MCRHAPSRVTVTSAILRRDRHASCFGDLPAESVNASVVRLSGRGDADARAADARTGTAGSCTCTRTGNASGRTARSGTCARTACARLGATRAGSGTSAGYACLGTAGSCARTRCRGACARSGSGGRRGRGRRARRGGRRRFRGAALITFVVTAAARGQRECERRGSDACSDGETAKHHAVSHGSNLGSCEWDFLANGEVPTRSRDQSRSLPPIANARTSARA